MSSSSSINSHTPIFPKTVIETTPPSYQSYVKKVIFVGVFSVLGGAIAAARTSVGKKINGVAIAIGAVAGCILSLLLLLFQSCVQAKSAKQPQQSQQIKGGEEPVNGLEEPELPQTPIKTNRIVPTIQNPALLTQEQEKPQTPIKTNPPHAPTQNTTSSSLKVIVEGPEKPQTPIKTNPPHAPTQNTTSSSLKVIIEGPDKPKNQPEQPETPQQLGLPIADPLKPLKEYINSYVESFMHPYLSGHITRENERQNRPAMIDEITKQLESIDYHPDSAVVVELALQAYFLEAARGIFIRYHDKDLFGDFTKILSDIEKIATTPGNQEKQLNDALSKLIERDEFIVIIQALKQALQKDFPKVELSLLEISNRAKIAISKYAEIRLEGFKRVKEENAIYNSKAPKDDMRIKQFARLQELVKKGVYFL